MIYSSTFEDTESEPVTYYCPLPPRVPLIPCIIGVVRVNPQGDTLAIEQALADKFWSLVNKDDRPYQCWGWGGSVNAAGHPRLKWKGKWLAVRRIAYELQKGEPPPRDMIVKNGCGQRLCVYETHFELIPDRVKRKDIEMPYREPPSVPDMLASQFVRNSIIRSAGNGETAAEILERARPKLLGAPVTVADIRAIIDEDAKKVQPWFTAPPNLGAGDPVLAAKLAKVYENLNDPAMWSIADDDEKLARGIPIKGSS